MVGLADRKHPETFGRFVWRGVRVAAALFVILALLIAAFLWWLLSQPDGVFG
jgi:hypothetical protein